jgi:L-ascorbate metabolism protein UlaG (beta-lactamase superfamily)
MDSGNSVKHVFGLMLVLLAVAGCYGTQTESVASLLEKMTWLRSTHLYGHTCIKVQTDELVIYADPVDLVDMEELPRADIILITHEHPDHFSPQTIAELSKESTTIVHSDSPVVSEAIGGANALALAPGQKATVGDLEIEGIPAYCSAGHTPELRGLGFTLSIDGIQVFWSGDTGLTPEMESLTNVDIAVLNVRKPYSLSGEQVVVFAEVVKPRIVIPIHWMPESDAYGDEEEIEYIRQHIPSTTLLSVLELSGESK